MRRFTQNLSVEMKSPYPNRRVLEGQCFLNLSFVRDEVEPLHTPCWIMIINIVALDMLKRKIPVQREFFRDMEIWN